MNPIDVDTLEAIAAELRAASAELDAVFKARGVTDGEVAVIRSDDEEALSAIERMRRVLAWQAEWLDATIA